MKEAASLSSKTESFIQTKQLSLFEDVNEKEVRKTIARELKHYKALKIRQQNKQELTENGISFSIFPKLLDNDNENENEFKVIHMERALQNSLDSIERKIIEMKYLGSERQNDINIYMELGLQKKPYYEKKKTAIFMIAKTLGII
ncbi:ArpU family phage packaging/lysis transcriptional regulator [Peribacillus sp. N1]